MGLTSGDMGTEGQRSRPNMAKSGGIHESQRLSVALYLVLQDWFFVVHALGLCVWASL